MAQPWPAGLQQFFSEENFSLQLDDGTLRSDMDVGPQKVRRRYTKGVDVLTVSIWLTSSEYTIFYNFYDVTIAGGTLPFTFEHPITGLPADFRFRGQPRISSIGGGNFTAQFELEILP
jgi:hypothetical protein